MDGIASSDWGRALLDALVRSGHGAREGLDPDPLALVVDEGVALVRDGLAPDDVTWALEQLQAHRRWPSTLRLAEALVARDGRLPRTAVRLLAQAYVEMGALSGAEAILRPLVEAEEPDREAREAAGLAARIAKQRYVAHGNPASLVAALRRYGEALDMEGADVVWHGPNVLALRHRAASDGVDVPPDVPTTDDARRRLRERLARPLAVQGVWERAATVEVLLSEGSTREAAEAVARLADMPGATAFAFGALHRQLVEVWGLGEDDPVVLALNHAHLRGARTADVDVPPRHTVEKILGAEQPVPFDTYRDGLLAARAVCRIETRGGRPVGTGFALRGAELHPTAPEWVVVTNHHVVSDDGALPARDARASFTRAETPDGRPVAPLVDLEQWWTSPEEELDVTVLEVPEMPGPVRRDPIRLASRVPEATGEDPHVFVVGHPSGRPLELSIRGNELVAADERLLQYRAPTEPGSSGSPVFSPGWDLVGVHHGWDERMPPPGTDDGPEAVNQASTIHAVRASIAARPPT